MYLSSVTSESIVGSMASVAVSIGWNAFPIVTCSAIFGWCRAHCNQLLLIDSGSALIVHAGVANRAFKMSGVTTQGSIS